MLKKMVVHELRKIIPPPIRNCIKYYILDQCLTERDRKIYHFFKTSKIQNPILLSGFRKSGNTWTKFIILNYSNILVNNAQKTVTYEELSRVHSYMMERAPDIHFRPGFPIFYATHSHFRKVFRYFSKIIYLYRNPLDTLISFYHMQRNYKIPFSDCPIQERRKLYDINYFVLSYLHFWVYHYKSTKDKGDVVLCYERMREDPYASFYSAFKRLGFPIDEVALRKSIEMSSFENIQKMGRETNQQFGMHNPLRFKGEFARSGKTLQYRDALKPLTIDKAQKILRRNKINV